MLVKYNKIIKVNNAHSRRIHGQRQALIAKDILIHDQNDIIRALNRDRTTFWSQMM